MIIGSRVRFSVDFLNRYKKINGDIPVSEMQATVGLVLKIRQTICGTICDVRWESLAHRFMRCHIDNLKEVVK